MTRLATSLWIKIYPTSDVQFLIEIMLLSLAIHFPNEIRFNWNEWWFIWSSQVSCPVVFQHFRNLIKLGRFYRITWDWRCTIVRNRIRWWSKEGNQAGFTSIRENTPNFLGDCFHCGLQRIDWITS